MTKKLFENQDIRESVADGHIALTESVMESATGKKLRIVEGVAAKAGIVNRNGRLYSKGVFETAVERAQDKLTQNKYLGELEHPWEVQTSLKRAAVRFTELWMEGDLVKYKGVILPTPDGQILESLLEGGVGVGVSTRGYGSYKIETIEGRDVEVIQDDFRMPGIDFVLDESNPHGAVHKFESTKHNPEGGIDVEIKNLEQLKAHYPELTNELTASVKAETEQTVKAELDTAHQAALATAKEEAVTEYKESEEGAKHEKAFNAIVESLKPFLPETIQLTESELGKQVEALRESETKAIKDLKDAQTKLTLAESTLKQIEDQKAVAEAIDAKVKGHKFESVLRTRLAECKAVADIETKFTAEVAFLESIGFAGESEPNGTGTNGDGGNGDQGDQGGEGGDGGNGQGNLNERDEKLRRLAGLK